MGYKISFVVVTACALFAFGLADTTAETKTVPVTTQPTTTPGSSTPITTLAPPTTSTIPPTTSTIPPTTSTIPPTTSTIPPTSSTPAPAPSTTAAPPSDGRGNWTVSDGNVTCIMARMKVSAKIPYPLNEVNKTGTAEIDVPVDAKDDGSCNPNSQSLKITWELNSLEIVFAKDNSTKMYYVNHISLSVVADEKHFPNISSSLLHTTFELERKISEFNTTVGQSYRCVREESLPLSKPNSSNNDAVLELVHVQLQAFHDKQPAKFGEAQDCELDTPDIVPIAVGCALAALVCVVLIAYLVGRRRSQALGYLSM